MRDDRLLVNTGYSDGIGSDTESELRQCRRPADKFELPSDALSCRM